jgi:hypothetical protein
MTLTKIRSFPDELPHARLYLDDLQEISNILMEAYRRPEGDPSKQPTIMYSFGDIRTDSIQDLRDRGGSASDVTIQLGYTTIRLGRFSQPSIYLSSLADAERWGVYSRIKAVFDSRRLVLKNFISGLPFSAQMLLYVFVMGGFPALIEVLTSKHKVVGWIVFSCYWLVFALIAVILIRPDRVIFVDSHERSKVSADRRRGFMRDIGMITLGAGIAKLIDLIFSKLAK